MLKTVEIFDLLKHKQNLPSDYALAKVLGVNPSLISHHRKREMGLTPEIAIKCADLLRLDRGLLLVWAAIGRANCTEERAELLKISAMLELQKRPEIRPFEPLQ